MLLPACRPLRADNQGVAATKHRDWLIALRAPRLGGAGLVRVAKRFDGVNGLVAASRAELAQAGLAHHVIDALKHPDEAMLEADVQWLAEPGHHLLTWVSDRFPPLLRTIPSPPAGGAVQVA